MSIKQPSNLQRESQTALDKYSYHCNIYSHSTDN